MYEVLILWYDLYGLKSLSVIGRKVIKTSKAKFNKGLKMRIVYTQRRIIYKRTIIKGKSECNKYLDDMARSFCSYIKHAERGKKDRRAIASASLPMRMHLKIIEEFHLRMSRELPGSTISIGGEEKKKKITQELQLSNLKETFTASQTLQATEDASKWNEALNPMLFALVHKCWFDPAVRQENNLPEVTEDQKTFEMICRIGFYYLLIKRINLGEGFIMENENFYTRVPWPDVTVDMLNFKNKEWFSDSNIVIDQDGYIASSPGFLMGMLNAASTTIGLVAIYGVEIKNTVVRSLRSSDDSMTVFVADTTANLCSLIQTIIIVCTVFLE